MKKNAIITYLLAVALLLSACIYRIPDNTQGSSAPALQESESTPSSSDTSPSVGDTATTPELDEFSIVSVGTKDYRVDACDYREITLIINGEEIFGMTLYACAEDVEEVIIPEEVNGQPVVAIGYSANTYEAPAFRSNVTIKRVLIPDTVYYIGGYAFSRCLNLTDLTLPSSVKWICKGAFYGCPGLKEIRITPDMKLELLSLIAANGLQKVTIDEGVTMIPSFCGCNLLTEIKLPSTVTRIGHDSSVGYEPHFSDTQITFLEIPEGVTYIGEYFLRDSEIVSLILPSTLNEIGLMTFDSDCLKQVFFRGTDAQCIQEVKDQVAEVGAAIYYYSETEPPADGLYWHYVDGKPVIW